MRIRKLQWGLAAVELALMLPIFLLIVTWTAEIGRIMYQHNTLTKSVRDGAQYLARYGVVAGIVNPTADQKTLARTLIVYGSPVVGSTPLLPGLAPSQITITTEVEPPATVATHVVVSISYPFQPVFGLPGFGIASDGTSSATLTASMRMRGLQ
ncbi:MAG TPA: TadE family protein [Verrucomicrobiae bacterium]|nr:TadE family protein [Verrucomicrobiae bacterium]